MKFSLETYQFKSGEKIASVGAGGALWEVGFGFECEGLSICVQDIEIEKISQNEIDDCIYSLQKIYKKPFKSIVYGVYGTEHNTNLKEKHYDKILLINCLHEFKFPINIISDLKNKLKINGGLLFVEEQLASFSGQIHEDCQKKLFTEVELIEIFEKENYTFLKSHKRSERSKIFCFRVE
ncbi:MAG: hypothetical protein KA313_05465 [Pseudarcicella sp.]|nr:hypothetical protein [Pseudarcicella sp.]MBP6410528.1 hypothetical protein [Pseudarcicella sp.]